MRMFIAVAGLMLMWLFCAKSDAAADKEVTFPKDLLPAGVVGDGETVDHAKKAAFAKAAKEIKASLKLRVYVVTEDYLTKYVLVDAGKPGEDFKAHDNLPNFKAWELTFRTDKDWWSDIVRRDLDAQRKVRAEEREEWTMRGVLGLSILLLAGFGYVRLDEYTQRRYTTWLRVAGLSAATTAIAVGWYVFFQAPG